MTRERALLVGRFQPPHRGHLHAIEAAAQRYARIIVAVGSAQHSHTAENPFTTGERFELLTAAFADQGLENVHLYPLPDLHRHGEWVQHVETLLPRFDVALSNNPLTVQLFRAAGYPVRPVALWKPDECRGTVIRARWAKHQSADDLLPAAVAKRLRIWPGAERMVNQT